MKRALIPLVLCLTSCSAATALTDLLPSKGVEATAQVGASNVKQGLGVAASQDNSQSVKDSTVGSVDTHKSSQSIQTGSVTAKTIVVKNNDTTGMLLAFLSGLLPVLLVEAGLWYWKRKKKPQEGAEGAV